MNFCNIHNFFTHKENLILRLSAYIAVKLLLVLGAKYLPQEADKFF